MKTLKTPTTRLSFAGGALAILSALGCGGAPQVEPAAMAASMLPLALDHALASDDTSAALYRVAPVQFDRTLAAGITMHVTGTVTAQRAALDAKLMELDVNLTRQVVRDGMGAAMATGHVSGHISMTIDDSAARTLDGQLAVSFESPRGSRAGTITLASVLRQKAGACPWPVGGSITRESGDQTHTLAFSGDCGAATLDGEPVDLADLSSRGGPGGRPF